MFIPSSNSSDFLKGILQYASVEKNKNIELVYEAFNYAFSNPEGDIHMSPLNNLLMRKSCEFGFSENCFIRIINFGSGEFH